MPPQHIAGTFQVPSLTLSNPCCQNWDILDPFPHDPQSLLPVLGHSGSPLASPVSSCLSPFSPSWRDWNLLPPEPSCIEAAISCPWIACRIPYPRCGVLSPMQRSRTGPPQPLPSTSRSHAGNPRRYLPFSYLPRKPGRWWVTLWLRRPCRYPRDPRPSLPSQVSSGRWWVTLCSLGRACNLIHLGARRAKAPPRAERG